MCSYVDIYVNLISKHAHMHACIRVHSFANQEKDNYKADIKKQETKNNVT